MSFQGMHLGDLIISIKAIIYIFIFSFINGTGVESSPILLRLFIGNVKLEVFTRRNIREDAIIYWLIVTTLDNKW
jgi:hypothetical protein